MMRWLERVFPYLLLAPSVLPLVYWGGLLYPYLTPKTLLFRADAILALAAFTALALSGRSFYVSRLRAWQAWLPAGLLGVAYIASLFGIDFYHSFWSVFDRGDGLLTLTCIVSFFYLVLLYADEAFLARFARWVALVASVVAVFTLLQWLQRASGDNIPFIPETGGRLGGTLGNAAFLASYLSLSSFITLIAAFNQRGTWKRLFICGALLQILGVCISATRGSLLALLGAALLTLAYGAWQGRGKWKTYARIGGAALVIAFALFIPLRSYLVHVPIESVQRLASISTSDATVSSRLFVWKEVGTEALQHPILGVGAEHISVLFNKVYDPGAIVEQWFDRSHDAFLDYFVQFGIFGPALYLAIILAALWDAFQILRAGGPLGKAGGLLFLCVSVYAAQNVFVFDTAVTLWLFMTICAILRLLRSDTVQSPLIAPKPVALSLGVGGLIALLVIPVSILPLYANALLGEGYLYQVADVRRSTAAMEKGLALHTYADLEYGYQLYSMYTEVQMVQLSGESRVLAYRFARDTLSQNFETYPYDARTAVYLAHVLDAAPPEIPKDEEKERIVIERAIELSPKRMQPWYLLANLSIGKADAMQPGAERSALYQQAIEVLQTYAASVPRLAEPRFVLATLYLTMGDREQAKHWVDEALPLYEKDLAVARRAASYFINTEDWAHARTFLADSVELDPTNFPLQYDLAKAEFLSGNVARAKEIVSSLREKAPGLVETDPAFLSALNSAK